MEVAGDIECLDPAVGGQYPQASVVSVGDVDTAVGSGGDVEPVTEPGVQGVPAVTRVPCLAASRDGDDRGRAVLVRCGGWSARAQEDEADGGREGPCQGAWGVHGGSVSGTGPEQRGSMSITQV